MHAKRILSYVVTKDWVVSVPFLAWGVSRFAAGAAGHQAIADRGIADQPRMPVSSIPGSTSRLRGVSGALAAFLNSSLKCRRIVQPGKGRIFRHGNVQKAA
jgi:hypothetical protein